MVAALTGLVTAGCISIYRQPPSSVPSAEIELRKPNPGVGVGITQSFAATTSPSCEKISFIGDFDLGTAILGLSGRHNFRAVAGQRIYLHADSYSPVGGGSYVPGTTSYSNVCTNVSSFVPEAGKRYAVVQSYNGRRRCSLDITSLEDNQPPATFVRHPVEPRCTRPR